MEKDRVTLTANARSAWEKLVAVGRAAVRKLTHTRMRLLAETPRSWDRDGVVQ